jgi:FdrA protein
MQNPPLPPRAPRPAFVRGAVRRGEPTPADERQRLAEALRHLRGVRRAAVTTGDPRDLAALQRDGMVPATWPAPPAVGDLVVVVEADSQDAAVDALARVDTLLLAVAEPPSGCANAVRSGPVAVLGSSEGALREVTTLIHHYGGGISCAVRTREHDLSDDGGGRSTLSALEALEGDPDTSVIVLVSTPPAPAVAARVLDRALATGAQVVAAFLGYSPPARHQGVVFVNTLEDAARSAASLSGAGTVSNHPTLRVTIPRFTREQRWLRGIYASGALAWEAVTLLGSSLRTASNLREGGAFFGALNDPSHLVVDLGDASLLGGHGHPRLDLTTRLEAIHSVANDPTSMVLLLDVPLGARAHESPGVTLGAALREARAQVAARGGTLVVVASVTGTDGDPQGQAKQINALVAAGAEVCSSNAAAVRRARSVAVGEWL